MVGSGNLRLTGWGATGEVFTQYDYSDDEASGSAAFTEAKALLDGLSARHLLDDFSEKYMERLWSRVPWLTDASPTASPVLHNLDSPLLDQFVSAVERVGTRPSELLIFAPFHDPGCRALATLLERTYPREATLLVQPGHTSIERDALADVMKRFHLVVRPLGLRGDHGRYVHAKVILARFAKASICFQGSANLSYAALMTTIPEGNVEGLLNLLEGGKGVFDHLLSDLWIGKPVTDPASLNVRFSGTIKVTAPIHTRLLEASWDGDLVTLRRAVLRTSDQNCGSRSGIPYCEPTCSGPPLTRTEKVKAC